MVQERSLDRESELILLALKDGAETTSDIEDATGIAQRGKLHYRAENALSDLVSRETEDATGAVQRTTWSLTEAGEDYVEEHQQDLAMPQTIDEVRDILMEAADDASTAKESVQNYRRKVHRLKERQDTIKDALGASWDDLDNTTIVTEDALETTQDYFESELRRYRNEAQSTVKAEVREQTEPFQDDVNELDQDLDELDQDLDDLASQLHRVAKAVEEREDRIDALESRLAAVEDRSLRDFLPF